MPTSRPTPITRKQVAAFLKPRPKDSNKGMFGTVTVIGGSTGMVGAALLAGRAALKLGAGCVHVGMLADNAPVVDVVHPELMLHSAVDALKGIPHPNPLGKTTSHSTRLQDTAAKSLVIPPAGRGDILFLGTGSKYFSDFCNKT